MNRAFLLFAAFLALLTTDVAFAHQQIGFMLHFDGVYQAKPGGVSQSLYLRFYPDNYVVAMSYAGPPEDVTEFIDRSHFTLPQGKYQFTGLKMTFTTKTDRGEIDYVGTMEDRGITFHIHSRITGFTSDEHFDFHEESFPESVIPSKPANQSSEPTPASVTPPAGQESRPH
jgi:hypothetical protein